MALHEHGRLSEGKKYALKALMILVAPVLKMMLIPNTLLRGNQITINLMATHIISEDVFTFT